MRSYWGPVLAILWKDLLLEARTREVIVPVLLFAVLVVVVFNFAIEPRPALVAVVAPGVLWLAFVFAGAMGLTRTFALEKEDGGIEGLMLCPVGRDVLYVGKMLGSLVFLLIVEALTLPVFAALFNLPIWQPEPLAAGRPRDHRPVCRRHRLLGHGRQHPRERGPAARSLLSHSCSCYHCRGRGDGSHHRR